MLQKWRPSQLDAVIIFSLGLMVLGYTCLYQNFAQDDAFITYRYARNIAGGHGFVYNMNEPVLGTTTPLYSLILALLAVLSGQEVRLIGHLVSAFSLWGASILLYYLGKRAISKQPKTLLAGATALVFMSNPLLISAIGMETFFLLFLLLLTLQSYLAGKFKVAALLLGLLILTRYETVIFGGILGFDFLLRRKQLPLWLGLSGLPVIIWLCFAWNRFGTVIPNSAQVKLIETEGYNFAVGALIWWSVYVNQTAWYYAFVPLILIGSVSIVYYPEITSGYRLILIWTGIYFVTASFVAGSFPWYYGPLVPGLAILLVWGLAFLVRWGKQTGDQDKASLLPSRVRAALFAVVTAGLIILQISSAATGWVNYRGQIIDMREIFYRDVAEWLRRHADHNQSLAVSEIGVLGYYSDMRIIDLRGLVTPALLPSIRQGRLATLHRVIELYTPDYLLTDEAPVIEAMEQYPGYSPVQTFSNGLYILYQRQQTGQAH